jgi:Fe-S-cluster formation regulator IscX/YfhJ
MRQLASNKYFVVGFIFLCILGFYFFSPFGTHTSLETKDQVAEETAAAKNEPKGTGTITPTQVSSEARVSGDTSQASATAPDGKTEIQNWLATESKLLNETTVDRKQKDLDLKKKVENFSDAEKKILLEDAHDTTKTANERILAAYMLVLDQSQSSSENLIGLAKKAMPDFGPVTAHSEAEIRRGQELSVRYMALDELSRRAANDPSALDALKRLTTEGESAEIRGYAQRILKEMK